MRWLIAGLATVALLLVGVYQVGSALQSRGAATDEHGAIHYRATNEAIIALTFDDGPDPRYTPEILDVLKANHIHATFFVIGRRAQAYPDILKRISAEGNEIGNHGFTHTYKLNSPDVVRNEIERTDKLIYQSIGVHTHLFRPPGGVHNVMIVNAAASVGHEVIMWSWNQDPRDWASPGVKKIVDHVLENARPGDIVLFHDGAGNGQTAQALSEIITGLKARHFRIVTVSELLAESTPAQPRG